MPYAQNHELFRADGWIYCSKCSARAKRLVYKPAHDFYPNAVEKAKGWDGQGRSPVILCKPCRKERSQYQLEARRNGVWPRYDLFREYLLFIMGPRAPKRKVHAEC